MKNVLIAVPAALLLAGASFAQTEGTLDTDTTVTTGAEVGAEGETFGTNWPLSVGTTFFGGSDSATLRSTEEVSSGWQSLSVEDQTMIRADCIAFLAAHGESGTDSGAMTDSAVSADASTTTGTDTTGDTATTGTEAGSDSATTGTATSDTDSAASGTDAGDAASTATGDTGSAETGTAPAASAVAGYDLAEMRAICEAVSDL